MPLGTNHVTYTTANAAGFVPEIWTDEIYATYKKALVAANLVKKMSVVGKKGDVVHIPKAVRGAPTAKAANTQVTLIAESGAEVTVNLDQHWEYSRVIEDIVEKQANAGLRGFYTSDAGYSLARKIDEIVLQQFRKVNGGDGAITYNTAVIGSDGVTAYTGTNEVALTDTGLRRALQTLDDNDVPFDNRSFIIPPVAKNTILGLSRFTEQAFVGDDKNAIRTGRLANLYGVEVFVTSLCETATGAARAAPLFHDDAVVLCMQMRPRVQMQSKLEYLGDLMVGDTIFGANELRNEAGIVFALLA